MTSLLDAFIHREDRARELKVRHAHFGPANPFRRVLQGMRSNYRAKPFQRSKQQAIPKTRQVFRHFLFLVAMAEVNKRESNITPRAERRKLARTYAAGEWRRDHPERGIKLAA
jgi:hypothetical protein